MTPPLTNTFYDTVPIVDRFHDLTQPESYAPLPDDWCLVTADISGSTEAITAGKYKAVNTVGVSVIAAVRNALRPMEIPYVFGGDGALLCVPAGSADAVRAAVAATQAMAGARFGLNLRAAIVPVTFIRAAGYEVRVARHRVSPHYHQCALYGGGADYAERALKRGGLPPEYLTDADAAAAADFSGLECRWQEVPSPSEETVAVIVDGLEGPERDLATYRDVLAKIDEVYGDAAQYRPVTEHGLRTSLSAVTLDVEEGVRTWGAGAAGRLFYRIMQRIEVMVGWVLMRFGITKNGVDWGDYRRDLVANSDFRKLDGCLRLVVSGRVQQREALVRHLLELRAAGRLVFGIHVATAAVVTCLIENRQSAHFHFVDAAGGGYASAARGIKGSG